MEQESLSTEEFAQVVRVKDQTVRHGLCVNGHYLGIKPLKLSNGRLLWPRKEVLRVVATDRMT
jgi:hypothetical protein